MRTSSAFSTGLVSFYTVHMTSLSKLHGPEVCCCYLANKLQPAMWAAHCAVTLKASAYTARPN